MTVTITQNQLLTLAPNAKTQYRDAFSSANTLWSKYQVDVHDLRLAHFLAQVLHETGGLTILTESLNYTHAARIREVWPLRFRSTDTAMPYVRNEEKLANFVYAGRMGNTNPGDGYKYRGRGLLQITGKADYTKYGMKVGADLVANPDLAYSAQYALPIALEEWYAKGCNTAASNDDIKTVTRLINGGLTGLDERMKWLHEVKKVLLIDDNS